jgi:phosphatidate cytidylyltransferase
MATPSASTTGGRDLGRATIVGLVLLALLGITLVTAPWTLTALIVVLIVVAAVELSRTFALLGLPVHLDVLVVASVTMLVGTHLAAHRGLAAGAVVLVVASLLRSLAQSEHRDVVGTVSRTVLLGLWLGGLASYAVLLRALESGPAALVLVILAAAAGDVFAYLVGSLAGRHRVAPTVSPNKTWEGLAGGLGAAAIVGALLLPIVVPDAGAAMGALLGSLVAFAAFLGDLCESLVKRDLGVKDLGSALPGHGGVLDRVDGILFALPVGHLLLGLIT